MKEGETKKIEIDGKDLLIVNIRGELKCFSRWCPHKGGDLAYGDFIGGNQIKCHLHGYIYNLDTGNAVYIPYRDGYGKWKDTLNLEVYRVVNKDGEICIEMK
ncbi:Rieske (2Fe-2S) protein [Sulfolobus acidocaldarius]|uniref:Rieske (2Fe-2S) protein n=1 Tax=Sulfolobus acidocaldarius TaxID=2285 RepID=UPI000AC84289|nr:Rieske (2Fe-2S) protein [Sulfolobus acidocaldarius]